jgi:hypothetical protein
VRQQITQERPSPRRRPIVSFRASSRRPGDLSIALKIRLWRRCVAYLGAIVPLTRAGLRAEAIPVGGLDVAF